MNSIYRLIFKNRIITCVYKLACFITNVAQKKHIFLTAANHYFFNQLITLLSTLRQFEKDKIIIYDIGLNENQIIFIRKKFENIQLVKFDFKKYPDYFNLEINHGCYAWKIALIYETFFNYKCDLTYLDARNYVTNSFYASKFYLNKFGYYFPFSSGKIKDWTHPETLTHFKTNDLWEKNNLNASYFSISYDTIKIRELMTRLYEYAFQKHIIAPIGSDRSNHRFDQSLLSCLFYEYYPEKSHNFFSKGNSNVITHFDALAANDFNNEARKLLKSFKFNEEFNAVKKIRT